MCARVDLRRPRKTDSFFFLRNDFRVFFIIMFFSYFQCRDGKGLKFCRGPGRAPVTVFCVRPNYDEAEGKVSNFFFMNNVTAAPGDPLRLL